MLALGSGQRDRQADLRSGDRTVLESKQRSQVAKKLQTNTEAGSSYCSGSLMIW